MYKDTLKLYTTYNANNAVFGHPVKSHYSWQLTSYLAAYFYSVVGAIVDPRVVLEFWSRNHAQREKGKNKPRDSLRPFFH